METTDEVAHAQDKLNRKNFDFIVLNSLRDKGAGFSGDTNKITVIDRQGHTDEYPLEAKTAAAERIAERIEAWFAAVPEKR